MTNENELKDLDMVIYDLTTIKTGLEKDGNSRCFLARVSGDAINLIKSQQAELEAAKAEIERLKTENISLQSGFRSVSFAGEEMDESCSESLDDAVQEVIDCYCLVEGDEANIRSWLFIDLPDVKVRIGKDDDYEVIKASPKPEEG